MRAHRVFFATLLLAAATLVPAVAGAQTWVNPVRPDNRGAAIPGATNGDLSASQLVTVEGSCQLAPGAALALTHLLAAARAGGVNLGPESCYRSVGGQNNASANACSSGNCACAATGGTSSTGGTSIHGWGKAVDFNDAGATVDFGTAGYAWLKANAGRYAFNHPGWAEPGGSACPEAWHWEWVGDGGSLGPTPHVAGLTASPDGNGYRVATSFGSVRALGSATNAGEVDVSKLVGPVVGIVATPDGGGYLLATDDGGVFTFGSAHFVGSAGGTPLAQPMTGIARTPSGNGYWLVARDGGIFSFGDATFHGSTGNLTLNQPIVGMAATPTGNGYWFVADDGGIFSFGDATFHGAAGDPVTN